MAIVPTDQDRATSDGLMGRLAEVLGFGGQGAAQAQPAMAPVQVAQGPAYDNGLGAFAFGDAFQQSYNAGRNQQIAQAQAQVAQRQAQQLAQARQRAIDSPSAANYNALLMLDPKAHESIKAAWSMKTEDERNNELRELTHLDGLLAAGQKDAALARIDRRIAADEAAGLDTSEDKEVRDVIASGDLKAARLFTGGLLTGVLGPEKAVEAIKAVGDDRRADAKLPAEVAGITAETDLKKAQTGKTVAEAAEVAPNAEADRAYKLAAQQKWVDDTALAADRLGLDREKFQAEANARLKALDIQQGSLTPQATTAVNNAVIGSQASRTMADRAKGLADAIQSEPRFRGGWAGGLESALTGATGDASVATQLKRQYIELRNSTAIKNLPPGVATDKDIQLAMKGLPPASANAPTLVSWLRGVEKLNNIVAENQDREADWMAGNAGSLGPAERAFFVGNTLVQPGAKFDDIQKAARREQAKAAAAARVGAE